MKSCPYCAEEIQDQAIVCRFCNRRVDGSRRALLAAVGAAVLLFVVAFAAFRLGQRPASAATQMADTVAVLGPTPTAPRQRPSPPPPLILNLFEPALTIPSEEAAIETFDLPARPCYLSGRIRGVGGGSRDVRVFVLDEDGYADWENGIQPDALFDSDRSSSITLDVELPTPGRFAVVISNRFSLLTDKVVESDRVLVSCGSR